ncbi:MAG: DNA mismatch repair protein MutS [Methylococcales symbiont of Hymedesmia sp. n. MRB-2018]|nr:MAG: DNA mismatch repair protein MutS [Methylococcales symbiont of Hymedesmia sp. n. MRB-2018]KAF3983189.1 MAG: DNA mismatch repair protein MutS [Methylococcales symbiont of Hymedesmia sp. n. MRB-2018]
MVKKTLCCKDSDLFRATIGEVKAIKNDKLLIESANKPKPYPQTQLQNNNNHFSGANHSKIEKLEQEDSIRFIAPGLQKNVLKKLRRGGFGLHASVDLHGLTSREANIQLSRFLQSSIETGCRCIHIIHGKGYRSANKQPVLKNDINVWLRQHKEVLAFCSAPQKEGGTGAVFVLLKLS